MSLLAPSDYDAVRNVLEVGLSANDLPDSTIALAPYQGAAEREVVARVPDAATKTDDDRARVKTAAILLTAARLVYAIPQFSSISFQERGASWSRPTITPQEREAELRALAEVEFVALGAVSEDVNRVQWAAITYTNEPYPAATLPSGSEWSRVR